MAGSLLRVCMQSDIHRRHIGHDVMVVLALVA